MAEIVAGVGTSHIPTIGAIIDSGRIAEPEWHSLAEGLEPARQWMARLDPDVCIVVYNDHASAFSLAHISTFALGVADDFQPADEGYGARPVPPVQGHPELAWHLAESLILDEFDMSIVNEMSVDHGLTVPLSIVFGQPRQWPCRVIPLCVNVVQYPPPTGNRCFRLGQAIRRAVRAWSGQERIAIFGTGGLSHQLQGERAGVINADYDRRWLDQLVRDPESIKDTPHTEYLRETGSEGIEAIMWLVMRGALTPRVEEVYRYTQIPVSNTHYALSLLESRG